MHGVDPNTTLFDAARDTSSGLVRSHECGGALHGCRSASSATLRFEVALRRGTAVKTRGSVRPRRRCPIASLSAGGLFHQKRPIRVRDPGPVSHLWITQIRIMDACVARNPQWPALISGGTDLLSPLIAGGIDFAIFDALEMMQSVCCGV